VDVESKETLEAIVTTAAAKIQTVLETAISQLFGNINLLAERLDGTIVQSDPITINIPKLTIWLKVPKEKVA